MATKTKVVHGWAYTDETVDHLMDKAVYGSLDDILFVKQSHASTDKARKRMTIRLTVEDYKPKRKTT